MNRPDRYGSVVIGLHWLGQRMAGQRPWNWQAAEQARDPVSVQRRVSGATP